VIPTSGSLKLGPSRPLPEIARRVIMDHSGRLVEEFQELRARKMAVNPCMAGVLHF